MAAGRAAERWTPWGYVGPALAWTMVFFVTPFLVMAWVGLGVHGTGDGAEPFQLRAVRHQ